MKYKYDPETDILTIKLASGKPDFGEQHANVITHYDKKGKAVELEIMDARKTTAKLAQTVRSSRAVA